MSKVEEIKAATAALKPEEQFQLYQWLHDSPALQEMRREELKREIAVGIEEVNRGELARLDISAVKAEGRRRLAQKGNN